MFHSTCIVPFLDKMRGKITFLHHKTGGHDLIGISKKRCIRLKMNKQISFGIFLFCMGQLENKHSDFRLMNHFYILHHTLSSLVSKNTSCVRVYQHIPLVHFILQHFSHQKRFPYPISVSPRMRLNKGAMSCPKFGVHCTNIRFPNTNNVGKYIHTFRLLLDTIQCTIIGRVSKR